MKMEKENEYDFAGIYPILFGRLKWEKWSFAGMQNPDANKF